jgi:precorrin-2 dehydrogenase/sirohydrochlorin ferrochelatase
VFPLVHDFEDRRVLVLGGGEVGARRARRLARDAKVVVVGPDFGGRDFGKADLVRAAPTPGDVEEWIEAVEPALVVAATDDPAVNAAAVAAGREHGALVNRADSGRARGVDNVSVPAVSREGPVLLAVATGGDSPTLSRHLRERLEAAIEGADEVAAAARAIEADLEALDLDRSVRRDCLRAAVESEAVWAAARDSNSDALEAARAVLDGECLNRG